MKGRYIGENIQILYDNIDYTDELDIPGLLFYADFKKGFDTIEWNFLKKL